MNASRKTLFLGEETFALLVHQVPNELAGVLGHAQFEEVIGTSIERFDFILKALGEGGRTQAFIGEETAGYLRNALAVTLLASTADFETRTGVTQDDAMELVRQLNAFIGKNPDAFTGENPDAVTGENPDAFTGEKPDALAGERPAPEIVR